MCSIYWFHKWNEHYTEVIAKNIDVVMPVYNLIEHSDNYLETSGSLWQYYRVEPALDANDTVIDFPAENNIVLFKSK